MADTDLVPQETILRKIYVVRDQRVMLDRDLAELYGVKAIRLREQVKRNAERFPENFMFQLTEEETETMVSQNAIPSKQQLGGTLPYVFTEHGVLQLANVLRSGRAVQMSISIIEVFVKMREMLLTHKDLLIEMEEIRKKVSGQDDKIELIFNYLKQFIKEQKSPRVSIGFKHKEE
ncbi:MAG: ORF6N domain-containing protein [Bacteroidetes bacterium]|nr:ORF6N domain-containing protein [Bacteroidota bacterium]